MAGIGILVNPKAGAIRRDPDLPDRMRARLGPADALAVAHTPDEVPPAIEGFQRAGIDVLGVVGGDGCNLYALTAATRIYGAALPPIAMLKGGSINTVSRYLGLRGEPEGLLLRLIEARAAGALATVSVPTLRVNDKVGFVFGGGLVANFYDMFYQGRGKGIGDVVALVSRCFVAALAETQLSRQLFAPVLARITADGRELPPRACTLMMASTIDNLLGFRVTYRAREEAGAFHLVASENHHRRLARQFYRAFLGRPLTGERHFDGVVREARIEFDRPRKYMVDGDLFEADAITLSPGPTLSIVKL